MKILVINAGSSSLKYQLIDMQKENVIAKGQCERIGIKGSLLTHKNNGKEFVFKKDMPNHVIAIQMVLEALTSKECGVVKNMEEISAVGHRVVHGAEDYNSSVLITPDVIKCCKENIELAPLHNPPNIMGIEACKKAMPNTPMVGVFDTAFHSTMPEVAYLYGIPYEDYKQLRIRRYGFHGTSHMFVTGEAIRYLDKPADQLKIITCHLGNGSSITAVKNGKCVDTSMGFTPLEGLPMGTRCGNIDAAVVETLCNKKDFTINETLNYLNKKCGMLGLSGVSSDFRDLTMGNAFDNPRNKLAVDIFAYSIKNYIGRYAAVMNGCDCIVFTAGVGENTPYVRYNACVDMEYLGVKIDKDKNENCPRGEIADISAKDSKVKILVIPTNEELVIARETKRIVNI